MLNRRTLPLSALRSFEAAAQYLHLGKAGEELGVTHGAVSHQIRSLEDKLGVKLFTRTSNRLALTPAGSRLYISVKDGLDRILDGTHNLNPDALSGPLVVACTQTIATSWAAKHICEFQKRYPTIQIHVREIHPRQSVIPRDIDIALCYGAPDPDDRRIVLMASPQLYPVCSPALMKGQIDFARNENWNALTLLHDKEVSWSRWFEHNMVPMPDFKNSIFFPNTSQALTAARLGYGVALCNNFETQTYIQDGTLILLSEKSIPEEKSYYLLSHPEHRRSLKSELFENWILKNSL